MFFNCLVLSDQVWGFMYYDFLMLIFMVFIWRKTYTHLWLLNYHLYSVECLHGKKEIERAKLKMFILQNGIFNHFLFMFWNWTTKSIYRTEFKNWRIKSIYDFHGPLESVLLVVTGEENLPDNCIFVSCNLHDSFLFGLGTRSMGNCNNSHRRFSTLKFCLIRYWIE